MNFPPSNSPGAATPPDPRLQATPDYGSLGPGSDVAQTFTASKNTANVGQGPGAARAGNPKLMLFAILVGAGLAIAASRSGGLRSLVTRLNGVFSARTGAESASSGPMQGDLDRQKPQKQAEVLLEQAVNRSVGANDQISRRVNRWRGRLHWDSQLGALTTAALNSSDLSVRASGIEVQLAAYGLGKDGPSADSVVAQADSPDHATKIWALWTLGLMGNRGVESGRVVETLVAHLKDSDEDSRRWAVEGLALVGSTETIAPLLQAMHDDPSPVVRERAACSLAESGMLTHEQRLTAVPQLLNYSDDPSLDAQTHAWAFQAVGDITGQRLPHDSAAWRSWYEKSVASGQ